VLEKIELETRPAPTWSVIWMHGLGADGRDFEPIVPQLVARTWPAIRFIFPHAPVRPISINGGMRMRGWYDILGVEIENRQDEVGIRDSIAKIERLIARERLRGIPSENVVLAGFSQGGAIALAAGLRHAKKLAGIVALSTYLPLADRTEAEIHPASRGTPVFMGHGTEDPVIPQALGSMSRDWLSVRGYPVQWHSYEMPHSVCPQEIADLAAWLQAAVFPRADA